jgi:hypothetical protein
VVLGPYPGYYVCKYLDPKPLAIQIIYYLIINRRKDFSTTQNEYCYILSSLCNMYYIETSFMVLLWHKQTEIFMPLVKSYKWKFTKILMWQAPMIFLCMSIRCLCSSKNMYKKQHIHIYISILVFILNLSLAFVQSDVP